MYNEVKIYIGIGKKIVLTSIQLIFLFTSMTEYCSGMVSVVLVKLKLQ